MAKPMLRINERLRSRLDALVVAVAEDPAPGIGKSEFTAATDRLSRAWKEGDRRSVIDLLAALVEADREEYEDSAAAENAELEEYGGPEKPLELPETLTHRDKRLATAYNAPADIAAARVLAEFFGRP